MNKKFLLTAGLTAAFTAGMAMTSLAGWEEHDGEWFFYKNNEKITDEWAPNGAFMYYLDSYGRITTDKMIDDTYYVNSDGVRVKNSWEWIETENDLANEQEGAWRYFGPNGKVYQDGIYEIDGYKYHFSETRMSTGWVQYEDDYYYFKEDGTMKTGWEWLENNKEEESEDYEEYWFYFTSKGKLVTSEEKTIDNVKYCFDSEGRLLTDWVSVTNFTCTDLDNLSGFGSAADLRYYDEDGNPVSGWQYLDSPFTHESQNFYLHEGKPFYLGSHSKVTSVGNGYGIAKIGDDYYCFDGYGHMITGLVNTTNGYRYFNSDSGKMETGRVMVYNDEFYGVAFYFRESGSVENRGVGMTGVYDGYLYDRGQSVCAEEGTKYEVKTVNTKDYLVNEAGKVKTSGTAKDGNGDKYTVKKESNGDYTITKTLAE